MARRAGVGEGTVSRVLNDSPKVSPATRGKVLEAIDALDYRPSALARGLSTGRFSTIGVVIPFFTHASAFERLRGVAAALHDAPYDLVLFNVESPIHRAEQFASLTGRAGTDGLLVMSLPPPATELARLVARDVPVVLVDARGDGVPTVLIDDVEGGRIATRHLVELGHRRIAFIGDDPDNALGFTSSTHRERGYREVLAEAGEPDRPELVRHGAHDRAVASRLADELLALPERPTAVFAASDVQATGVLEAARRAGLEVPRDLSVVGFDDIELSEYLGLTTVHQRLYDSGELGMRLLLDALADGTPPAPVVHDLPLRLVERRTTCPVGGARPGPTARRRRATKGASTT
ncbi:MAG TPA: LacI family DNA-binding transcriptional regulator [Aquihabitans sp.]|nr:LacI family DNA-binding transcriptional regulator [Aquihabitans sp.]